MKNLWRPHNEAVNCIPDYGSGYRTGYRVRRQAVGIIGARETESIRTRVSATGWQVRIELAARYRLAVSAMICGLLPLTRHALRFCNGSGYHKYEKTSLSDPEVCNHTAKQFERHGNSRRENRDRAAALRRAHRKSPGFDQ